MRDTESVVAEILHDWSVGAPDALDRLVTVVYESLCFLAQAQLRRERPDHMLDTTALVHEAYIKLAELHTPTLVIVGASDFVCSPVMARELAAGIAGAELFMLDRSGHFGHVEQPDAFAAAVIGFLERLAKRRIET